MSIDINHFVWPTSFSNTIVTENIVIPNSYNLKFSISPNPHRDNDVVMGFKKMKYFSERRLMNSVFISKDSPILPNIALIENNKVIFPTEPSDFYLGAVLFCKFIAITNRYFHIDFMTIDSMVGDRVQYTLRDPSDCDLDLSGSYWWNMDTTYTGSGKETLWTDADIVDRPGLNFKVIEGGRDGD